MDKNKSRTDLLAAGRKKLQQFRQKKDVKGGTSHGKSSKKATKSEQRESSAVDAATTPQDAEVEAVSEHSDPSGTSAYNSLTPANENPVVSEKFGASVEAPMTVEPHSGDTVAEISIQAPGQVEGENTSVGAPIVEVSSSGIPQPPDSLEELPHASVLATASSVPQGSMGDASGKMTATDSMESTEDEESLLSREYILVGSLNHAERLQVGATLEAGTLGTGQPNEGCELDHGAYDRDHTPEVAATIEQQSPSESKARQVEEARYEMVQAYECFASAATNHGAHDDFSLPLPPGLEVDGLSTVSHEYDRRDQEREDKPGIRYLSGKGDHEDAKGIEPEQQFQDLHFPGSGGTRGDDYSESDNVTSTGMTTHPAGLSSIKLSQLIDVVKGLEEDEYNLLLASRGFASGGNECISPSVLEKLEEELFLANFTNDVLCWQLAEHAKVQVELCSHQQQSVDEALLQTSVNAENKKNGSLTEQLVLLKSELQAVTSGRYDLENQLHAKKLEAEELHERLNGLQTALEVLQQNFSCQSIELADCKSSLAVLQMENHKLRMDLVSVTEERSIQEEEKKNISFLNENLSIELAECQNLVASLKGELSVLDSTLSSVRDSGKKLEEEKECLTHEYERLTAILADSERLVEELQIEKDSFPDRLGAVLKELEKTKEEREFFNCECDRLSSELISIKEQFSSEKEMRMQSEDDLQQKEISLEKLSLENKSLNSTVDMYMAKISELNNKQFQADPFAGNIGSKVDVVTVPGTESVFSHQVRGSPVDLDDKQDFAALSGFDTLKNHSSDFGKMLMKLEKAIEGMHLQSACSNKSDRGAAPGISKLIQAFESKGHHSEQSLEAEYLLEEQSPVDPYISSQEIIRNMKLMVKQLGDDVENAALLFRGELDHRTANAEQLTVQEEIFREHVDSLEAHSIELGVLYEVVKQHLTDSEFKKTQLGCLCENLERQDFILRAENRQLILKLEDYESRISNLQNQLHDSQRTSGDVATLLGERLEYLQREATESAVMNQLRWTVVSAQILESVQKLHESTTLISTRSFGEVDLVNYVALSVTATIKVIEDLQEKLKVAGIDRKAGYDLYQEVNEKLHILQGKNDLTNSRLHRFYDKLRELVLSSSRFVEQEAVQTDDKELPDPLDESNYGFLLERLRIILDERQQTKSEIISLQSQLSDNLHDIKELESKCIDMDLVLRLIDAVGGVVELEAMDINLIGHPLHLLESLIKALVQKCGEGKKHVHLSMEELESRELQLTELQEKLNQSCSLNLQHENEILSLRESLSQTEKTLAAVQGELKEKAAESEQSEHRVSSIREKLSIAVAKGKGLVVQRDNLKQTLTETSSELEKCLKELESKDARLQEVEEKLTAYSESGERVEALESELSYIRNSATALRESFLLKDSLLQRIEEILEDLDLPEHFHFKDIIEKVDWLARSVAGNALPPADLDHKSSVGGSHSDAGFVVMDAWREDMQPSSNPNDDFRRKYDELQGKFYGLAEQNEMLEQSLMERNNRVQRWEGLLDRINVPMHIRSVEPEEKIEWLANALTEAHHIRISLEQKIAEVETHCGSLTSDLEDSHCRLSSLQNEVEVLVREKEYMSQQLETLTQSNEELSTNALHLVSENENMLSETRRLQEELTEMIENGERVQIIEQEIHKLGDMVSEVLLDSVTDDICTGGSSTEILEGLLKKLFQKYAAATSDSLVSVGSAPGNGLGDAAGPELKTREAVLAEDQNQESAVLEKELDEALGELIQVKEQRDELLERNKSLIDLVEGLERKRDELQGLLDMEEQKCASVREKLNVAVRKGKTLVQQRDSLKSTIEEMNSEVDRLKTEVNHREDALAKYELKIQELSSYPGRMGALESEISHLRNQLTQYESHRQDRDHIMGLILSTLADIDVGEQVDSTDPVDKLVQFQEICSELRANVASLEQESKKSKRAAELLLAELNEVQERNDSLQEQIAEAATEITRLSEEKDAAILQLNKFSSRQTEEKGSILSELMTFKSMIELLRKMLSDFQSSVADVLREDIEVLKKVEASVGTCLQQNEATGDGIRLTVSSVLSNLDSHKIDKDNFLFTYPGSDYKKLGQLDQNLFKDFIFLGNQLQDFFVGIDDLKEDLQRHYSQLKEQASSLSEILNAVRREIVYRKESSEVMESDIKHLTAVQKKKDTEIVCLRRNMALLHEACFICMMEFEKNKDLFAGNSLPLVDQAVNRNAITFNREGFSSDDDTHCSSEESVRSFADRMISAAKNLANAKSNSMEIAEKELKNRIAELQNKLLEKDIEKDRICMELVGQIKAAEAAAMHYSSDLQSTKALVYDLEQQVKALEEGRSLLEEKVQKRQDEGVAAQQLQENLRLIVASKDQEIEALMQALDEEEVQMDDLTKKIQELEKVVQQKDLVVEELEISRAKALKKLSMTMSKFHELHHFSSNFLAEVEKLQIQLNEKDAEISFLRQEVTRCTNDVLVATQMSNNPKELLEFLTWCDGMLSQVVSYELDYEKTDQVQEYRERVEKKFASLVSELENLQAIAENKEALLLVERNKIEELLQKELTLEKSLREKESQLNLLQGVEDSGHANGLSSEIVEIEPLINKRAVSASTASQVRSLRKPNNDQVAIAIDMDPGSSSGLKDEDDDKVHGFKSLATSRVVPRFTRGVTDMVDGLWVSCDRALMRKPVLRLGIIMYWAVLHALLASFIV